MRIFSLLFLCIFGIGYTAQEAYIADVGNTTISKIDTATNTVTPIDVGVTPRELTITPDGSKLYATENVGDDVVLIDLATGAISTIPLSPGAQLTAITSNNTHVFAISNNDALREVYTIDTSTNTQVGTPPDLSGQPGTVTMTNVKISPDQRKLWVADSGTPERIFIFDLTDPANLVLEAVVPITGTNINGMAFTAEHLYAVSQSAPGLTRVEINPPYNVDTVSIVPPMIMPQWIDVTPDGTVAYITDLDAGIEDLHIYDIQSQTLISTIPMGNSARFGTVDVSPDGSLVYVTNFDAGVVTVIDPVSNVVTGTISGFTNPFGIAFQCEGVIHGSCSKNVFLTQIDYLNVISWTPIVSAIPVNYQIWRNGEIIAILNNPSVFEYKDSGRQKGVTDMYSVFAETEFGLSLVGDISVTSCR